MSTSRNNIRSGPDRKRKVVSSRPWKKRHSVNLFLSNLSCLKQISLNVKWMFKWKGEERKIIDFAYLR